MNHKTLKHLTKAIGHLVIAVVLTYAWNKEGGWGWIAAAVIFYYGMTSRCAKMINSIHTPFNQPLDYCKKHSSFQERVKAKMEEAQKEQQDRKENG